jgi:hypothetical protein
MNFQPSVRFMIGIVAVLLALSTFALAGPPLVCHRIEIGPVRTLPWVDLNYRKGVGNYDLNNLSNDTLAILDSNPSVLVHMETLRRATIYARQDPQVAKELLTRLHARASNAETGSTGALAWFDLGYLAETYKQWFGQGEPDPARALDGLAWVGKAIQMRGSDPEMEFAAALITLIGPERDHNSHVQKAMDGAHTDPLLAQNLASTFHNQTISALLTSGREPQK